MHVLSLYLHTLISTVIVKKIIVHDVYHMIETIKFCSSDHIVHFTPYKPSMSHWYNVETIGPRMQSICQDSDISLQYHGHYIANGMMVCIYMYL